MSMFCASDSDSRPSPPFLCASGEGGLRGESSSASADRAAGILVETGNSVDYSLAIRLLSLRWLSLLHHEIAWLSARLESVLCSNPPHAPHPPPQPACSLLPLHPFIAPSLPLSPSPAHHTTPPLLFPTSGKRGREKKKKEFVWLPSGQPGSARARQVDWLYSPYYLISCDHGVTPSIFFLSFFLERRNIFYDSDPQFMPPMT